MKIKTLLTVVVLATSLNAVHGEPLKSLGHLDKKEKLEFYSQATKCKRNGIIMVRYKSKRLRGKITSSCDFYEDEDIEVITITIDDQVKGEVR